MRKWEIYGVKIMYNTPHGYLIDDGEHRLWIEPEAKHGYIYANLKSVWYKNSDRVYTSKRILNNYENLAELVAKEIAKTEPIYDYSENVFYDPKNPLGYWKRNGVVYNE